MNHNVPYAESVAANLDLEPIMVKLCHPTRGSNWEPERANAAIELYRHWLFLHQTFPNEEFSPSQEIDFVWHAHLLDTRKYTDDCQELFGRMLHHNPYAGMLSEEDERKQLENFEHTKRRMAGLFPSHYSELSGKPLCMSGYCDGDAPLKRPTMSLLSAA